MKKISAILLVACMLLGSLFLFTGCADRVKYEDEDSYASGPMNTPNKDITAIEIYWTSGEVEIRGILLSQIGTSGVTVWEDYTANNDNTMRTRLVNGVLQIYPSASGTKVDDIPKKKLTVDLPLDLAYRIESISVTALGDTCVSLDRVNPNALTVNTRAGDVTVNGTPKSVSVTTVGGNLNMTGSVGSLHFISETGSADLALLSYGFAAVMENASGRFETDYAVSENGNIYSYGTQSDAFRFDTAGTVKITKSEGAK